MSSMSTYGTHQDSGLEWIGAIPSHWQVLPFFRFAPQNKRSNKGMINDNLLSLSYGRIIRRDINSLEGLLPESFETYQVVEPNDIIFRLTDLQNDKRSLRSAICSERGIITSAYLAVTPRNIEPLFLAYLMRAYDHTKVFYALGSGLRQSLKYDEMKRLPVLVPPLPEQTQIARFLDYETAKIDRLIDKQRQLIALLKEKRQAVISHAVTKGLNPDAPMKDSGIEWLGKVPAHWDVVPLKHHTRLMEQGWSPQCDQRPAESHEWGVLKVGCVNGGVFEPNENKALPDTLTPRRQYRIQRGDLLISRANTRDLVGSAAVVLNDHPNLLLCDKLYRLRLKETLDPRFVAFFLGTSMARGQIELEASGASHSMQNIGQATIQQLPIPTPPAREALEIVDQLSSHLELLDLASRRASQQVELLQERRTALISAAVTGKIDVRDWTPPESVDHADHNPQASAAMRAALIEGEQSGEPQPLDAAEFKQRMRSTPEESAQ